MREQFYWDKHIFLGSDHRVEDTAEPKSKSTCASSAIAHCRGEFRRLKGCSQNFKETFESNCNEFLA